MAARKKVRRKAGKKTKPRKRTGTSIAGFTGLMGKADWKKINFHPKTGRKLGGYAYMNFATGEIREVWG